jgi:hypothetical protein
VELWIFEAKREADFIVDFQVDRQKKSQAVFTPNPYAQIPFIPVRSLLFYRRMVTRRSQDKVDRSQFRRSWSQYADPAAQGYRSRRHAEQWVFPQTGTVSPSPACPL